jgi:hypothetical protein
MLNEWHEFYALLGTAGAALLALLFVAVSIATSVLTPDAESRANTRTFMSPVVYHYANTLFLSLVALIPAQTWHSFALILAIAALGSLLYSCNIAWRVHKSSFSDLPDRLAYGFVPLACYATGLISAWLLFQERAAGLDLLAAAALVLLVTNIRNAWDLMLSLARRVNTPPSGGG